MYVPLYRTRQPIQFYFLGIQKDPSFLGPSHNMYGNLYGNLYGKFIMQQIRWDTYDKQTAPGNRQNTARNLKFMQRHSLLIHKWCSPASPC